MRRSLSFYNVCATLLLIAIALWTVLPVLPDEVANLYYGSRVLIDGGRIQIWPLCTSERWVELPQYLIPLNVLQSLWSYINNPLQLRILGVFICLVTLYIIYINTSQTKKFTLVAFGLISIGTLPLNLVSHRAEYLFLPYLAALLIFARSINISNFRHAFLSLTFASVVLLMGCMLHPKYLLFSPTLIVGFIYLMFILKRWYLLLIIGYLLICIYKIYQIDYFQFAQCTEVLRVEIENRSFNIDPNLIFSNLTQFIREVKENLGEDRLLKFFSRILFHFNYSDQINFLPNLQFNYLLNIFRVGLNTAILAVLSAALFMLVIFNILSINSLIKNTGGNRVSIGVFFIVEIGVLINFILNKSGNYYDSPFWVVSLIFIMVSLAALDSNIAKFNAHIILKLNNIFGFNFLKNIKILFVVICIINLIYVIYAITYQVIMSRNQNGINLFNKNTYSNQNKFDVISSELGIKDQDKIISDDYGYFFVKSHPISTPLTWLMHGIIYSDDEFVKLDEQAKIDYIWNGIFEYAIKNDYKYIVASCGHFSPIDKFHDLRFIGDPQHPNICIYKIK